MNHIEGSEKGHMDPDYFYLLTECVKAAKWHFIIEDSTKGDSTIAYQILSDKSWQRPRASLVDDERGALHNLCAQMDTDCVQVGRLHDILDKALSIFDTVIDTDHVCSEGALTGQPLASEMYSLLDETKKHLKDGLHLQNIRSRLSRVYGVPLTGEPQLVRGALLNELRSLSNIVSAFNQHYLLGRFERLQRVE